MRTALRRTAATILTGGRIDRWADEIEAALAAETAEADTDAITSVVADATDAIPFYQKLRPSVGALEDMPVIDKMTMRGDLSAFMKPGVQISSLSTRSTSGSTGIPFTVYMEPERATRNRAGAVASLRYAGGDPFAPSVRTRAWSAPSAKEKVLNYLKEDYAFNGDHFQTEPILDIARWMRGRRRTVVQGYPSYMEKILHVFEDHDVTFQPGEVSAVMSGAEAPTSYLWEASERVFGVFAHARYSNMELGLVSTTSKNDASAYKVDTSTFHVEILDEDSDVPVAPGELGRIVVTDLHNRVMPLLRYDTGDMARFAVDADGAAITNVITDIRGRRLDVLVAGTAARPHRAHPLAVWGAAATMSEIRQFQLRQLDVGHFTWVLNAEKSGVTERRLRETLDERVGDIVSCDFEYVDEVPVMASGKRQFFVNEIDDPADFIAQRTGVASPSHVDKDL